jgi:hypothetical protein
MMTEQRDTAQSVERYEGFIEAEMHAMNAYLKYQNPRVYNFVARSCVKLGKAHYARGSGLDVVMNWLRQAGEYHRSFIADGRKYELADAGTIDDYLELLAAAFLAGNAERLIEALQRCVYTSKPLHPPAQRLFDEYCAMLLGQEAPIPASDAEELGALYKDWGALPPVVQAAARLRTDALGPALDAYLSAVWGKSMDKWARTALKSPRPDYYGRFCFFAAACCRVAGIIPPLGKKAASYLPVELVSG